MALALQVYETPEITVTFRSYRPGELVPASGEPR
jgi:hypothetical protein